MNSNYEQSKSARAEGLQAGSLNKNIISKLFAKAKINSLGISFYETSYSDEVHYIYDERTNVMLGSNSKDMKKRSDIGQKVKFFDVDGFKFLVIYKKQKFKAQILEQVYDRISNMVSTARGISNGVSALFSEDFAMFLFDVMRMILDIREGWMTPIKVISTLMSMYSIYNRFSKIRAAFRPQVYFLNDITFDSVVLMLSAIGIPKSIMDAIKTFTELTGRKLFNSNMIMTIITLFYDITKNFLSWMTKTIPSLNGMTEFFEITVDYLFSTIVCYNKIKEVVALYSRYVSDASVIMDPKFRVDCETLHDKLIKDQNFREYVDNSDNKHFKLTWDGFCNNLMKYIKNFDVSRRDEPICIVLEGAPGSGKSVLMNNIVEYLVRKNKSVYVHTVPPTMGGKDFYDDYENQDVFVMDDVGQQGVSQWRTIINFVAPIKYPLECAEAKKKNTKFFNSKYIIVTTNKFTELSSFTSSDCIAEPGALFRRAHVLKVTKGESPSGKHTNDIKYYKYDYKDTNTFKNEFLYHNKTDSYPTSQEGLNTKESLIYVMSIFNHLDLTEEENRKSSVISDDDFDDIDKALREVESTGGYTYRAQFKIGDYFGMLRSSLEEFLNGGEIFKEWYSAFTNRLNNFVGFLSSFFTTLINGKMPDDKEEIRRILSSNDPFVVLGISRTASATAVTKAFRALALKYHPDKAPVELKELHNVLMVILNNARLAIINDCEFNVYPEHQGYMPEEDLKGGAKYGKYTRDFLSSIYNLPRRFYYWYFNLDDADFVQVTIQFIFFGVFVISVLINHYVSTIEHQDGNMDHEWEKQASDNTEFLGTTGVKDMVLTEVVLNVVKKSVRFVTGIRKDGTHFSSQAVVGGRSILLNSHTCADMAVINIYNSYDHFKNQHIEQESITIIKVKDFPSVDLCVYRLDKTMMAYKAPKVLFESRGEIKPYMYLVSSMGIIPMISGQHFQRNKEEITYTAYGIHYKHRPFSGLMTNVQGDGFCGTLMVNPHGSIVGVHVAGDGVSGFCVTPSEDIVDSIRSLLITPEGEGMSFDIDGRIKENFSGARLRYDNDKIQVSYVGGDVPMTPSLLHRDINAETRRLIGLIHHDPEDKLSSVPDKNINNRQPPNLSPRPAEKLKEMSVKAFKLQGFVNDNELQFIDDCISHIMPEKFDDVCFDEAAFGGELAAMAKDTANGYGHVKEKEMFFDFERKVITEYGWSEFNAFRERVEKGVPEFKDFLSKEVFKVNELRNEEKADKPRTIRVMPITHIFWTKVICGNIALHFKKNMHETGVCVGFNPYKDFHELALKLKGMDIVGDADYGGWDGTLNARIMFRIFEIFQRRYVGKYPKVLEFLGTSIVRSMVLVSDELYATTHGMPSGTWLTLLLNCLVNKAIQALTIYRNKENPSVQDFMDVVSYVTGDDDIFGTPTHLSNVFNLQTLKETAESLGMTCTNGDKTPIQTKGHDFSKLNYLKRHFRYHPVLNKYMGCLSLSTIINTFQYVDGTKNYDEAMQGKINAVLVEAYIHSPALYKLLSEFFKDQAPMYKQLDVNRVQKILTDDEGYLEILTSLGKSYFTI